MGYQQKLLLVSSLFIVGMGVLTGIHKFYSSSATANLHALLIDLYYIAGNAQEYYHKPKDLTGGGLSFAGITSEDGFKKLFIKSENENGIFKIISSSDDCLTVQAVGHYDTDDDGQNLTVEIKIYPDNVETAIISR